MHKFVRLVSNLLRCCTGPRKDLSSINVVGGFSLRMAIVFVSDDPFYRFM